MKKALTVLLAVLLVATAALTFAACSPCKKGLHEWDEGLVTTQPTCEKDGVRTVSCLRCGETDTVTIPASGHQYGNLIDGTTGTCLVEGAKAHYECSVCHKLFVDDNGAKKEVTEAELNLGKGNHVYGNLIPEATPDDCTKDGKLAHYECSVCHKLFVDDNGEKKEVAEADLIVPAHHTYTEENWTAPVEGDCKTRGTLGFYECQSCHQKISKQGAILTSIEGEYGAHQYGEWHEAVKGTDCMNAGTKGYQYCSVCEKNYDKDGQEIADITGEYGDHNWDEQHEAKTPNCQEGGNIAYKHCSACNKYYNEAGTEINDGDWVLGKTDTHDYTDQTWTSDRNGKHYMDCTVCNEQGRKEENCKLVWHREGDKHYQTCSVTECGYTTSEESHDYKEAQCDCGALKTDFDVTSNEELEALVPNSGDTTEKKYFAIGTVKSLTDEYNAAIYIIDENGHELYVYALFNENGTVRYGKDDPKVSSVISVGDVIVVYGVMTNYNGTIEMKNSWLVQVKDVAKTDVAKLLLDDTTVVSPVSKDFDLPTYDGKVKWYVDSNDGDNGEGITIENYYQAKVKRSKTKDVTVVLRAEADVDGIQATKNYTVVVKQKTEGGESIVLTVDTLKLGAYAGSNTTVDVDGMDFTYFNVGNYGNGIQMRKATPSKSLLWNSTEFSGRIVSITIKWNKTTTAIGNVMTLEFGTTNEFNSKTEDVSRAAKDTAEYIYTVPAGTDYTYVRIGHNGSANALYIDSITIVYEQACEHDTINKVEDGQAATCLADGWETYYRCADCGQLFSDEQGNTPISEKKVLPKLDHQMTEHALIEAKCTEDGTKKHYHCALCDRDYEDEQGSVDITGNLTITQTGHSPEETLSYDQENGENGHYHKCSVCGERTDDVRTHTFTTFVNDGDENHKSTCECGFEKTFTHTWKVTYVDESEHETRCTANGCGAAKDRTTHEYDQEGGTKCACGKEQDHVHNYTRRNSNAQGHWLECELDGAHDGEPQPHVSSFVSVGKNGHKEVCSVCQWEINAEVKSHSYQEGGYVKEDENTHSGFCTVCQTTIEELDHEYDDVWASKDDDNHARTCKYCDNEQTQSHSWITNPDQKPEQSDAAQHVYKCAVDGCTAEKPENHDFGGSDVVYKPISTSDTQHAKQCAKCEALDEANPEQCTLDWTRTDTHHQKACATCGRTTGEVAHSYDKYSQTCECGKINPAYLVVNQTGKDYSLDFQAGWSSLGGSNLSSYTNDGTTYTGTDNVTYQITNHNNNNKGWDYIKIAAKNVTATAVITTSTVADAVNSITLKFNDVLAKVVINITVKVMKGGSQVGATVTDTYTAASKGAKDMTVNIGTPTAGCTYEISVEVNNTTSSNGGASLQVVTLAGADTTITANESTANVTPATCEDNGKVTFKCTDASCDQTHEVTIPAVGHVTEKVDEQAAKCEEAGWHEHYKCTKCSKTFRDQQGLEEWNPEIEAQGHTIAYRQGSDGNEGKHQEYCTACSEYEGGWVDHVYAEYVGDNSDPNHMAQCEDCKYDFEGPHTYSQEPTYVDGEENHRFNCTALGCEAYTEAPHDYDQKEGTECACGAVKGHTVHTYEQQIYKHNDTHHWFKCDSCDFEDTANQQPHDFSYNSNDDEQHNALCGTCSANVTQNHDFTQTDTGNAEKHHVSCTLCAWEGLDENHNFTTFEPKQNDSGKHEAMCEDCMAVVDQDHKIDPSRYVKKDNGKHDAYCTDCEKYIEQDHSYGTGSTCACGATKAQATSKYKFDTSAASAKGTNSDYTKSGTVTVDGIKWQGEGNISMQPWRLGGKSTNCDAADRSVTSQTPLAYNVEKIIVSVGATSSMTVNSLTIVVARDADFSDVVETFTPEFKASTNFTLERPAGQDWNNCYYKVTFNLTSKTTSNGYVQLNSIDFWAV